MNALYRGLIVSGVIAAVGFYFVTDSMMGGMEDFSARHLYYASLIGLALTAAMVVITEYYTAESKKPAQSIAAASQTMK